MIPYSILPHTDAILNFTSAVFLVSGYLLIRAGKQYGHHKMMAFALSSSLFFLVSYVIYHLHQGTTRFQRTGWLRTAYLSVLLSHTVLAAAIVPLVIVTFVLASRRRFTAHRRVARWTFPIWLYVSLTGVIVYAMLYHL